MTTRTSAETMPFTTKPGPPFGPHEGPPSRREIDERPRPGCDVWTVADTTDVMLCEQRAGIGPAVVSLRADR